MLKEESVDVVDVVVVVVVVEGAVVERVQDTVVDVCLSSLSCCSVASLCCFPVHL